MHTASKVKSGMFSDRYLGLLRNTPFKRRFHAVVRNVG
jgi:hypothetical protein